MAIALNNQQEEEFATLASPFDAPVQTLQTMVPEAAPVEAAPFSMENWYSDYKASDDYNSAYNIATSRYNEQADEEDTHVGEFRGYGSGTGVEGFANKLAGTDVFHNKITESGAAKYIDNPAPFDLDYDYDYDTSKLYMKTPDTGHGTSAMYGAFGEIDAEEQKRLDTGSYVDISGGTAPDGSYSMVWIQDPPEGSMFQKALGFAPLRIAAAYLSGGTSEGVIAAGKGLAGETLHASDWLSIATAGLTISGALKAPVNAAAAADAGTAAMQAADAAGATNAAAMAAGTAAQELALAGKGLALGGKALDYKQSLALMNVAATGKPENMLMSLYGGDLINSGLAKVGITEQTFNDLGIQYDDFQAGLTKTVEKVAAGEDFDTALLSGLGKYITEGGTIGNASGMLSGTLSGIDLKAIEDLVRDVVRPIGSMATALAHYVEEAAPDTSLFVDAIKAAGSVVDDEVLQPTKEAVEAGASVAGDVLSAADTAARDALSAVDDAVIQPTGQALSDLDTAIRDALGDVDLDIPSFNPDVPNLSLGGQQQAAAPRPSPTRTTDELFKFTNKIQNNQEMIDFSVDPFAPDYRGL